MPESPQSDTPNSENPDSSGPLLRVDGAVENPGSFSLADLRAMDPAGQVPDVRQLNPTRPGTAIRLQTLLDRVQPKPEADYLGLHAESDDFHASIPLAAVREQGLLIYELEGHPLSQKAGGPLRFFIPDHSACHTSEVDECANVKFVEHIELTVGKGYDNRPLDDDEHAKLHEEQD